jgi:hypothetical protein
MNSTFFLRFLKRVVIRQKYFHSALLCQSVIKSTIAAHIYKPCSFDGFNYSNLLVLFVLYGDLFDFGVGAFVAMVEVVFAISAF